MKVKEAIEITTNQEKRAGPAQSEVEKEKESNKPQASSGKRHKKDTMI